MTQAVLSQNDSVELVLLMSFLWTFQGPKGTSNYSDVSFVDCPGCGILMAAVLTGAALLDAALLWTADKESCPQPQTLNTWLLERSGN